MTPEIHCGLVVNDKGRYRQQRTVAAARQNRVSKIHMFASEFTVAARNFIPLTGGLGIVDGNVHYHSLLGLATRKKILGPFFVMATIRSGDLLQKGIPGILARFRH